nr:hypothetical protein [uncultured Pseudomonas sp.]
MSTGTFMLLCAVLLGIAVAVVDLLLIAAIYRSRKSAGAKFAWAALVVLAPLIGWGIWGRWGPRGLAQAPSSPEHSK